MILLRYGWDMKDLCLRNTLDMPEMYRIFAWYLSEEYPRYAWDNPKICLGYVLDITYIYLIQAECMSKKCLKNTWFIFEIWLRYTWDIHKTYLRYTRDIPKIYQSDMPLMCPRFTYNIPRINLWYNEEKP